MDRREQIEQLRQRLSNSISGEGGVSIPAISYGEHRSNPLQTGRKLFYTCGIPLSQVPLCEAVLQNLYDSYGDDGDEIDVIVQTNFYKLMLDWAKKYKKLNFIAEGDARVPAMLATYGFICILGVQPPYLTRRPDQRVIQVWNRIGDRIAEKPKDGFFFKTRFLNSTEVITSSPEETDSLIETMQLNDIYRGAIRTYTGLEDGFAEAVAGLFYGREDADFHVIQLESDKRKVLIHTVCTQGDYWQLAQQLAHHYSGCGYDVTVVLPSHFSDDIIVSELAKLGDSCRIIIREGSFSCDAKNYIDTQVALNTVDLYDSYAEWEGTFSSDACRLEAKRLFGDTCFDAYLAVANPTPTWFVISRGVDAGVKKKIELGNVVYSREFEAPNTHFTRRLETEGAASCFDEVACFDAEVEKKIESICSEVDSAVFQLPLFIDADDASTISRASFGEGEERLFVGTLDESSGGKGSIIHGPKQQFRSFLLDVEPEQIEETLGALSNHVGDDGWEAFVYGTIPSEIRDGIAENYLDKLVFLGLPKYLSFNAFIEYAEGFEASVLSSRDRLSLVRAVADVGNLDRYILEAGAFEPFSDKLFSSVEEIVVSEKAEMDRLLETR